MALTEYERDQAFMEGHRNAAAESYFSARSDLMTTPSQIARFDAGFSRGWDAGRAPLLERIAALEAQVDQAAQPVADPFTYVIQHLNSNPYALTKDECIEKIKELRPLYTSPPKAVPLTDEQREVLAYLDGSGPLDGVWFGDKHPIEKGAYWWRARLWSAFGTPATVEKEGE